jgi:methylmalonyl-CoA/ethylmalonyl-CoA epimerase
MARIKHLAFFSDSPEKMAQFYVEAFGFTIKGRGKKSVWVTDGYLDIAMLWRADETHYHSGLNHFGITLDADEREGVYQRLAEMGHDPIKPPSDRSYVEDYVKDVDGNKFDLSTSGVEVKENLKTVFKEPAKV